jgi:uncharacterized protein
MAALAAFAGGSLRGSVMLYAIICTDKPNSVEVRKANRPQHLDYLRGLGGKVVLAGPFTAEDGQTMIGSLIVVDADSSAEARKLADGDPFVKAGLFETVDVRPWIWSINNPAAA